MIQQYIKGKSLDELLYSIKDLNVDDFFKYIHKYNLKQSIPSYIMKQKYNIVEKNVLIKKLIIENNFHLLPRNKDGICYHDDNLYCGNNNLTSLPDNLTINGKIYCYNNDLTSLPNNLIVNGDLKCYNNNLTSLPDNLNIKGTLNCSDNNLTFLPDNLTVNGDLNCSRNNLISLPDNLTVNGNLACLQQKNGIILKLPKTAIVKGEFLN